MCIPSPLTNNETRQTNVNFRDTCTTPLTKHDMKNVLRQQE